MAPAPGPLPVSDAFRRYWSCIVVSAIAETGSNAPPASPKSFVVSGVNSPFPTPMIDIIQPFLHAIVLTPTSVSSLAGAAIVDLLLQSQPACPASTTAFTYVRVVLTCSGTTPSPSTIEGGFLAEKLYVMEEVPHGALEMMTELLKSVQAPRLIVS